MELRLQWTGQWRWFVTVPGRDGSDRILCGGCCGEYRTARSSGRRALRRLLTKIHKV